MLRWVQED